MVHRILPFVLLVSGAALTGGCAQFPALGHTVTPAMEAAPYPDLVPIEPLLAQAEAGAVDPARVESSLSGRAAGLQARAQRIEGATAGAASADRVARLRARAARLRAAGLTAPERARLEEEPAL